MLIQSVSGEGVKEKRDNNTRFSWSRRLCFNKNTQLQYRGSVNYTTHQGQYSTHSEHTVKLYWDPLTSNSCQFRGDVWSARRVIQPLLTLPLQIRTYPNYTWCWVDTDPIHWPKILPRGRIFRNLKTKIYKTIIFPVVLYGYEAWSLILREECRLKEFENKILRRIFRPKRNENGEWRKLYYEELHSYTVGQILSGWLNLKY